MLNRPNLSVIPTFQRTPLLEACEQGYVDVVKLLVEHKSDVNAKDMHQVVYYFEIQKISAFQNSFTYYCVEKGCCTFLAIYLN